MAEHPITTGSERSSAARTEPPAPTSDLQQQREALLRTLARPPARRPSPEAPRLWVLEAWDTLFQPALERLQRWAQQNDFVWHCDCTHRTQHQRSAWPAMREYLKLVVALLGEARRLVDPATEREVAALAADLHGAQQIYVSQLVRALQQCDQGCAQRACHRTKRCMWHRMSLLWQTLFMDWIERSAAARVGNPSRSRKPLLALDRWLPDLRLLQALAPVIQPRPHNEYHQPYPRQ